MKKLKLNPDNAKYYSEEFIKGFECGVERQYEEDMKENTAEWKLIDAYRHLYVCLDCGQQSINKYRFCPYCGKRMVVK